MQECIALAKVGIPWGVIMEMDTEERRGYCIAAGIVEGGQFDWQALQWKKPDV